MAPFYHNHSRGPVRMVTQQGSRRLQGGGPGAADRSPIRGAPIGASPLSVAGLSVQALEVFRGPTNRLCVSLSVCVCVCLYPWVCGPKHSKDRTMQPALWLCQQIMLCQALCVCVCVWGDPNTNWGRHDEKQAESAVHEGGGRHNCSVRFKKKEQKRKEKMSKNNATVTSVYVLQPEKELVNLTVLPVLVSVCTPVPVLCPKDNDPNDLETAQQ